MDIKIQALDQKFTVCTVKEISLKTLDDEFCFIGKTDEELSIVCPTENVPPTVIKQEDGWRAFRIQGCLDFSLVGILAAISAALAEHNIPIFALSTYNTDYVLVKEESYGKALAVLKSKGYRTV